MSVANLQRHGFEVHDVESLREHYVGTCRLWLAYLAGCSLAFQFGTVGIFQSLASKRVRGPAELPTTRVDLYEDWPRSETHSRFPTRNRFQLVGNGCAEEVLFISRSLIDSSWHADL